jgi:hypothetical protein
MSAFASVALMTHDLTCLDLLLDLAIFHVEIFDMLVGNMIGGLGVMLLILMNLIIGESGTATLASYAAKGTTYWASGPTTLTGTGPRASTASRAEASETSLATTRTWTRAVCAMRDASTFASTGTMQIADHAPPAVRGSAVVGLQPGGGRGVPITGALRTCPPRYLAVPSLGTWANDHAPPAACGNVVVRLQPGGGCQVPAA